MNNIRWNDESICAIWGGQIHQTNKGCPMAHTDHHSHAERFILPGPQAVFPLLVAWYNRRRKRKAVISMLKYEDWLLRDMGLTRGDVLEALAKPGDASDNLKRIAAQKRCYQRSRRSL